MTTKRPSYPLQWPEGQKRTPASARTTPGRYGTTARFEAGAFTQIRDQVIRQLDRRGSLVVITSNLPTRNDGLPYASASSNGEPGVAVWWVERGKEHVLACDKWTTVGYNLRAIALSIEAIRGLERWGAQEMADRAFSGFAALPPGSSGTIDATAGPRPWRDVLGEACGSWPELAADELLVLAKSRHRKLVQIHHPDRGGDPAKAAELNAALDRAERELTEGT